MAVGAMGDQMPSVVMIQGKAELKARAGAADSGGPAVPKLDVRISAEMEAHWGGGRSFGVDAATVSLEFEVWSAPPDEDGTVPMVGRCRLTLWNSS
jgi:hypothetical protein